MPLTGYIRLQKNVGNLLECGSGKQILEEIVVGKVHRGQVTGNNSWFCARPPHAVRGSLQIGKIQVFGKKSHGYWREHCVQGSRKEVKSRTKICIYDAQYN